VDITNPVNESFDGLVVPPDGSATEELAALAGGARWVKPFNTTFAIPLKSGTVAGDKLDVLLAGDDADAKGKVAALARDGGLNPIDVGPPEARARARGRGPALHGSPERVRQRFRKRPHDRRLTVGSPPAAAPEARA
jgi:8-hydroxy-5-deazaflavin:NADPH oxidoreductase